MLGELRLRYHVVDLLVIRVRHVVLVLNLTYSNCLSFVLHLICYFLHGKLLTVLRMTLNFGPRI